MFRCLYVCRGSLRRIQSLVLNREYDNVAKLLCGLPREGNTSESEWHSIVDELSSDENSLKSVLSSLVITSASLGYLLTPKQKGRICAALLLHKDCMSDFDKIVFIIGSSQLGMRTEAVVEFTQQFIGRNSNAISQSLLPSLLLAVANLGVSVGWNKLIAQLQIEDMQIPTLANTALAIVTSRTFPISTIERILEKAATHTESMDVNDAVSLMHSFACWEVYRTDLFRKLLNRISLSPVSLSASQSLIKQIIVSVFIDPKANDTCSGISPAVWDRLDRLVDWTVSESKLHLDGDLLEQLVTGLGAHETSEPAQIPVPKLAEWTPKIAKFVVMNRMYLNDIQGTVLTRKSNRPVFVHIDVETFPDLEEGPIDPYLQLKHLHVNQAGAKLAWIKPRIWALLEPDEQIEYLQGILNS